MGINKKNYKVGAQLMHQGTLYKADEPLIIWNNPFTETSNHVIGVVTKNEVFIVINVDYRELIRDNEFENINADTKEIFEIFTSKGLHGWIIFYNDWVDFGIKELPWRAI